MRKSKMTSGRRPFRPMITGPMSVRGELRNWQETHGTDVSYFSGEIYGDRFKQKRDGESHKTGKLLVKLDRGDYWLIKTEGPSMYMLYKNKEYKP